MEGSTLGGLIISQMLRKQLGMTNQQLTFFKGYGNRLIAMWYSFKATLDKQPEPDIDTETGITTADATFRQFKKLVGGIFFSFPVDFNLLIAIYQEFNMSVFTMCAFDFTRITRDSK
jgi:hypothetical protein